MMILTDLLSLLIWSVTLWLLFVIIGLLAAVVLISIGAAFYVGVRWCVRKLRQFVAWWERYYGNELEQRRRICEADARALGALKLPEWPAP